MDNSKKLRTVSMCHGYGGIELGVEMAGDSISHIAICEIEAFAVDLMVQKMEAGLIDPAPIWTDIKTFSATPFRGRIDLLLAGYPCQPFSSAGARRGADDPRHLWPYIINWVQVARPSRCFFENVEGHITLGLSAVLSDLESSGYKTTWGIFSASEVGAPHQRKRVFILAESKESIATRARSRLFEQHQYMRHMADAHGKLWSEQTERWIDDAKARSAGEDVANPSSEGFQRREQIGCNAAKNAARAEGAHGSTSKRSDGTRAHRWPSRPGETQHDWEPPRTIDGKLNPDWVEVLMGLPPEWTGTGNRIDRLRLLGNGVVPQTAGLAWKTLNERFENARI